MTANRKEMTAFIRKKYYLPLISALLLAITILPYHLLITNFIFLIPLLFFLRGVDNWKDALKGGIWFGVPMCMMIVYWLYAMLKVSFLALVFYLAFILYFPLFIILFVLISFFLYKKSKLPFFIFTPFLWIVIEHLRTYGPLKFTGDHISNSMALYPYLIQFIDVTGPYGITFWLIIVNALLFEAFVSYKRKSRLIIYLFIALLLAVIPSLYSLHIWKELTFSPDLKISMVQPNIPLEKKFKKEFAPENMAAMQAITQQAIKQKPDLLIWPETSFPYPVQHWIDKSKSPTLPEISALAQYSATPILIGAEYVRLKTKEDYDIYNAAFLMDSRGTIQDYYGKIYLVPLAEGIPLKELFGIKRLGKTGILSKLGGFTSGGRSTIFEIEKRKKAGGQLQQDASQADKKDKVSFGVIICYEGLYPELSRKLRKEGADFLVCITNDAWFGNTVFPYWHASALRMRAIENRASVVRCANTGISSFYDPAGRMYQSTELFTKSIVSSFVSTMKTQTFYTKYGNIVVYISYPFVIILILFCILTRKKSQRTLEAG